MEKREVRITKKGIPISRWVFLDNLKLCFRYSDNRWIPIRYNRGIEICKRIAMNVNHDVQLHGNFISTNPSTQLNTDNDLQRLLNGERIIK